MRKELMVALMLAVLLITVISVRVGIAGIDHKSGLVQNSPPFVTLPQPILATPTATSRPEQATPSSIPTLDPTSFESLVISHLIPQTPDATPGPDTCGPWSEPQGSVGGPISQAYGELRNCLFFENSWIILTEGLRQQDGTRQSGIVAAYRCEPADLVCLNGQEDHPISGWQIYEPPCPGELLVGFGSLAGKLAIMGTCASYFEVATGIFSSH